MDEPWDAIEKLSRQVHARPDLADTLREVLGAAVDVCSGVRAAGVNLYERGRFAPQAVVGPGPHELDELQRELGEGPCIEASRTQDTVLVPDTAADPRWPAFCARARDLGLRAVICVPLWVDDAALGSLSFYADRPDAFGADVQRLASLVATQSALAIAGARRADNLRIATDSRDVIGQAKGILMERFRLTADEAFELLVQSSQRTRYKLQRVAELLSSTGELPVGVNTEPSPAHS